MTAVLLADTLPRVQQTLHLPSIAKRGLHATSVLSKKHLRAGVFKVSPNRNIPLTYEEAKGPHLLGVEKAWLAWNTSNLVGEKRQSETLLEDGFIRRFMQGTWHEMFVTDIVIKRRYNLIVIAGFLRKPQNVSETYFLIGYTEEILSLLLKCPVKLELQTVMSSNDVTYKYI